MGVFRVILQRDLRLAFRRWSELANPLIFYIIVASLFPLAVSTSTEVLRILGIGVVWIAVFLSSLLGLDGLFRADAEDGSMEQLVLSPVPLGLTVVAKIAAHWVVSSLPLLVLVPMMASTFRIPIETVPTMVLALLLVTPTLSIFVAVGAAVTVSLKTSGSIIGLIVLPLCAPLLIFGAQATDLAMHGEPVSAPLFMLGGLAAAAVSLGPLAIAAGLRVSLE